MRSRASQRELDRSVMSASVSDRTIRINRAPVLTLWAAVVAERLGFDRAAALTLERAVAGSSAQMKGRALGIYEPSHELQSKAAEERRQDLDPEDTVGVRLLPTGTDSESPDNGRRLSLDLVTETVLNPAKGS